jgi:hypothetical protein
MSPEFLIEDEKREQKDLEPEMNGKAFDKPALWRGTRPEVAKETEKPIAEILERGADKKAVVTSLVRVLCVYGEFVRTCTERSPIHEPEPKMKRWITVLSDRKRIRRLMRKRYKKWRWM